MWSSNNYVARMGSIAVAVGVVAALSGCSSVDETVVEPMEIGSTINGIELTAELDPQVGSVTLPFDQFAPTPWEEAVLTAGISGTLSQCALDKGVVFRSKPPVDQSIYEEIYSSEHYFGPWTQGQAARWGFVTPQHDADLFYNGVDGGPTEAPEPMYALDEQEYSGTNEEIIDECRALSGQAEKYQSALAAVPWAVDYPLYEEVWRDFDKAESAVDDLAQCLTQRGLAPVDEEPWWPLGARADRIDEEQISMALTVVECKESVNFTQRMADVEVAIQMPMVKKYAQEMHAHKDVLDEAFTEASGFLAKNPDLYLSRNPASGQE